MANLTGRKHAFAVCNGTAALELAVKAIGIEKGDEVIMPTFTIISCALAVIRAGGVPVYVDSDWTTFNMQVDRIEPLITEKTKAIMAVHIYGLTVDMNPLLEIAQKYKLRLIEDAAEVIGQTYKGKPCGSFGDISTFSFYPNKHVTTGEGGMVLVNDDELSEKCNSLRNLCFGKADRFIHEEQGWNFRMSNLQAAVGVAQLERLPQTIQKKREIGSLYQEALNGIDFLDLPMPKTEYCENAYWVFGVLSRDQGKDAKWWGRKLATQGIGTRPFFHPMHKQPCLNHEADSKVELPESEFLGKYGFYLPSGLTLTHHEVAKVANALVSEMQDSDD
jgi:perosamine synthetase